MHFKITREARNDLREIGRYTQRRWGKEQRRRYLSNLDRKFALLAENPQLGRKCSTIRKGYFRYEYISHTIFYRVAAEVITVSRVIHKSRDVKAQFDDGVG